MVVLKYGFIVVDFSKNLFVSVDRRNKNHGGSTSTFNITKRVRESHRHGSARATRPTKIRHGGTSFQLGATEHRFEHGSSSA